jgi:hypothetical protein
MILSVKSLSKKYVDAPLLETAPQVDSKKVTIHDIFLLVNIMFMKETIEISGSCGCLASITELDTDQVSASSPFCAHVAGICYLETNCDQYLKSGNHSSSLNCTES